MILVASRTYRYFCLKEPVPVELVVLLSLVVVQEGRGWLRRY